jgi:O-antigen ligase
MSKSYNQNPLILKAFIWAVFLTLFVPLIFTPNLLYPFVSTKAFLLKSLMLLALPLYLYLLIAYKNLRPNFKNPLTISLTVFVLLALVSAVFGVDFTRSFWGNYERMDGVYYLLHLYLLYLYLLLVFKADETAGKNFLLGTVWVAGVVSVYGILEKCGLVLFNDASLPDRASATFGNPIFFASFLILPIFLSVFFAFGEQVKWKRYFYWAFAAAGVLAVFLSGTRGAVVGLVFAAVAMGFVYVLFNGNKKVRKTGAWVLLVCVLVLGSLFYFGRSSNTNSFLGRVFNLNDSNSKARLLQWESGIKGFKDHPILGVGPENYNVIANKYFNPEIYKYDSSWFDKPHNYPLEILLTNGLLGLLAYIAVVFFCCFAFWRAYKNNLIGFLEFCLFFAAMLAYQVQNLFAFDTTSAAWMFFIFLAFSSYLWQAASPAGEQSGSLIKHQPNTLAMSVAAITGILVLYIFYVTDWTTLKVLYNLNIAYAMGINNPQVADGYFQHAVAESFIYDMGDLGQKYSEFAVAAGQDDLNTLDHGFLNQILDNAAGVLEKVTAKIKNNPIYWYELANDYDTKSIVNKTGVDPKAQTAVNNAIALAPNRVEPKFFQVQIYGLEDNIPAVVSESETIANAVPFNPEVQWRLALAYKDAGRLEDAVSKAEQALSMGYKPMLVPEIKWLINYYADQKDYQRVADLYQMAIKLTPNDYQLYASIATVYAKLGDRDQAIAAAYKVLQLNPGSKPTVDAFLESLQN